MQPAKVLTALAWLVLFGAFGPVPAIAQGEPEALVIEEVIVTARKREESLQDIALSVSAFNTDEIVKRGVNTLRELSTFAPNVAWVGARNNAVPIFSVRGVQSYPRSNIGFESSIGVYLDGVVIGRPIGFNQGVFDIERVEFLRGPQGTLFGKNSIGGAINITTKNPGDEFEADLEVEVGEHDTRNFAAYIAGPLVEDTLAASISIRSRNRDGIVENVFNGNDVDDIDEISGRVKLRYTPNDRLALTLSADHMNDDSVSASAQALVGYASVPGQFKTNVNNEAIAFREMSGATLTIDYDINDDLTLTSITAYRTMERQGQSDTDVGPIQVVDSFAWRDQDQVSQELRVAGGGDGPLKYVAGLYYFNMENDSDATSCFGPFPPPFNFLTGLCGSTYGTIETTSYAAFANVDYDVTDTVTLTGGLRWTDEERELNYAQIGFPFLAPNLAPERDSIDDSDFSPLLSVKWNFSDNAMAYLTASRGFKSGGWNVDNVATFSITSFSQLVFGSESVWNYELGFKSTLADGRVRLNGAAFFMDYDDLQVTKLVEVLGGGGAVVGVVTNAGKAEVTGVELELAALLTPNLELSAGMGYTNAEYKEYSDLVGGMPVSFANNKLDRAPEWTANASLQYTVPFESVDLVARADYTFRDSYFVDRTNSPLLAIDSVSLLNAKIGVRSHSGRWDLFLFAENALDEDYFVSRGFGGFLFTGSSQTVLWGQPRTVTLRAGFHY